MSGATFDQPMVWIRSIKFRLYLLLTFLFISLLGISGFSLYTFKKANRKVNAYIGDSMMLSVTIGRIEAYDREEEVLLNRVFEENAAGRKSDKELIEARRTRFERLNDLIQDQYDKLLKFSRNELKQSQEVRAQRAYRHLIEVAELTQKNYVTYVHLMRRAFTLVERDQTQLAKQMFDELENTDVRIARLTKEISQIRDLILESARSNLINTDHLSRIYLASTLLILPFLGFLIFSIVRGIMTPLNLAIKSTEAITKGARAPLMRPKRTSPEFTKLFDSIEKMLTAIRSSEQEAKDKALQLQQTNSELDSFASTAAHDLKSPLNTIVGYADLLEQRLKESGKQEELLWISRLKSSSTHMSRLIDDLLAFSRTAADHPVMENVDLNLILEKVLSDLQARIQASQARISAGKLPMVKGSRALIYQVFLNLIENSMKYCGKEAPKIEVEAFPEGNHVTVTVKDNGMGIPSEYRDKVFNIFQRGIAPAHIKGTGIGLATVKKIIDQHGGKIWLTSDMGQGTTFFFTLPSAQAEKELWLG